MLRWWRLCSPSWRRRWQRARTPGGTSAPARDPNWYLKLYPLPFHHHADSRHQHPKYNAQAGLDERAKRQHHKATSKPERPRSCLGTCGRVLRLRWCSSCRNRNSQEVWRPSCGRPVVDRWRPSIGRPHFSLTWWRWPLANPRTLRYRKFKNMQNRIAFFLIYRPRSVAYTLRTLGTRASNNR